MKVLTTSLERKFKSYVPNRIKKLIVVFLCNKHLGKLIKKLGIQYNLFGGYFDYSLVSDVEAAHIFWGVWESSEIRFSKRFIDCETIIELGSSVGVTLGVLAKKNQNKTFICIEASNVNFEKLKILSYQLPKNNEYILINKAIAYGVDNVSFFHTSTTGSRITDEISGEQQYIAATTLKNIISEYEVQNDFCLISDIEGAESSIFFEDASSLQNCKTIVADLEDTGSHTCEQQIAKLISVGFSVVERYANVVVMTR